MKVNSKITMVIKIKSTKINKQETVIILSVTDHNPKTGDLHLTLEQINFTSVPLP